MCINRAQISMLDKIFVVNNLLICIHVKKRREGGSDLLTKIFGQGLVSGWRNLYQTDKIIIYTYKLVL